MAITTIDGVISALNSGQRKRWWKYAPVNQVNGNDFQGALLLNSTWTVDGVPSAGAVPSTGVGDIPTSSTLGALDFTTSGQSYILYAHVSSAQFTPATRSNIFFLYDRLWHNSGLDGTVTSDTTFGPSTALTRPNANGENTELWMEVYTAIGSSNSTLSVTYTNQSGQTGRIATWIKLSSGTTPYSAKLTLQAGDTGVRSVESYSWSATTGAAGNFGLVIARKIMHMAINVSAGTNCNWFSLGMPRIDDGACLYAYIEADDTTISDILFTYTIGQG